ncbi:MAG TPA: glutathione S-transferase family protein [Caulobacterales bacterium]|nr:glutathione S-transferase family protein [Caulobacterales bacterium]
MSGLLTIYGDRRSGNCLKGKWVADLLGVPNAWIEIDIFKGESRTPEFLAMNPAGQVPTAILPDGRALAQSNAIMLYLAEGSRLVPSDPYQRAKMYEWLFWEQYNHEPSIAVRRALLQFRGKSEAELDPALLTKGNACLERMALQLEQTPYLVGDALSLADIALVAYTRVAHEGGYDLNQYPLVKAWVARVERDLGLASAQEAA